MAFAAPRPPPRPTGSIEYEVQQSDSFVWSSADLLGRGATSYVFKGFSKVLYFLLFICKRSHLLFSYCLILFYINS